jgi:hypothetical protein
LTLTIHLGAVKINRASCRVAGQYDAIDGNMEMKNRNREDEARAFATQHQGLCYPEYRKPLPRRLPQGVAVPPRC